jgi:hypothetical protein
MQHVFRYWIDIGMNLASPLSAFCSLAVARTVEVLAGTTRPLTGREISRISGYGSVTSVWRALGRLAEEGLVSADYRGTAVFYAANRDHLAWPAIEVLVRLRTELTTRLVQTIGGWPIQPLHASVFGSTARGDGDSTSDIDLLLVQPDGLQGTDEAAWNDQVSELRRVVVRWTGNGCQAFQVDRARLDEHVAAADPLVDAWIHDGVVLAGAPLNDLIGDYRRLPIP